MDLRRLTTSKNSVVCSVVSSLAWFISTPELHGSPHAAAPGARGHWKLTAPSPGGKRRARQRFHRPVPCRRFPPYTQLYSPFLSRPAKEIAKVDCASKCAPQWEVLGSVKELVKPGEVGRAHPTSGRPWSVVGAAGNS